MFATRSTVRRAHFVTLLSLTRDVVSNTEKRLGDGNLRTRLKRKPVLFRNTTPIPVIIHPSYSLIFLRKSLSRTFKNGSNRIRIFEIGPNQVSDRGSQRSSKIRSYTLIRRCIVDRDIRTCVCVCVSLNDRLSSNRRRRERVSIFFPLNFSRVVRAL